MKFGRTVEAKGRWVCFNCRVGNVTLRKLEIRRTNPNNKNKKKKGKVVGFAYVCDPCYKDGHTRVPMGFNGEIVYVKKQLPDEMMKFLQTQKEIAETKIAKAKKLDIA